MKSQANKTFLAFKVNGHTGEDGRSHLTHCKLPKMTVNFNIIFTNKDKPLD